VLLVVTIIVFIKVNIEVSLGMEAEEDSLAHLLMVQVDLVDMDHPELI
jgi:hypothetical protein